MITDIAEVNNFIVLIEQSNSNEVVNQKCTLDNDVIGLSFYVSGEVELTVNYGDQNLKLNNSAGHVTSFYGNKSINFNHEIQPNTPLKSISIFSTLENLKKLPKSEYQLFSKSLNILLFPEKEFVIGPFFYMTPTIQSTVYKIFENTYTGATRMMFLKSQVLELLTHFFDRASIEHQPNIAEQEKLFQAKEIISNNIENPPTLSELSKMIGLNDYKLKKNFKELFGVPVFKYLQNERLIKAHSLITCQEMSVQQAGLFVGYESLSSFSNAFLQKFGYRPSELKK